MFIDFVVYILWKVDDDFSDLQIFFKNADVAEKNYTEKKIQNYKSKASKLN